MSNPDRIVSKSEFAKIAGVSPGRVTQWIDEGKISGDGLVGEGRSARIRADVASRQVNLRRDVGQALGNGIATRLDAAPRAQQATETASDDGSDDPYQGWAPDGSTDDVDRKLKAAKLEAAERANRIAAAEEAASQGLYTETAAVRAEMGRIAGQMVGIFEGALPEVASALAATLKVEEREVLHALREQFRKVREQAASAAADHAAALQEAAAAA